VRALSMRHKQTGSGGTGDVPERLFPADLSVKVINLVWVNKTGMKSRWGWRRLLRHPENLSKSRMCCSLVSFQAADWSSDRAFIAVTFSRDTYPSALLRDDPTLSFLIILPPQPHHFAAPRCTTMIREYFTDSVGGTPR